MLLTLTQLNLMISSQYEKPQLDILMFELEDVLTSSATSAPTTLPGTTSADGVEVGKGDIVIDFGDFFK